MKTLILISLSWMPLLAMEEKPASLIDAIKNGAFVTVQGLVNPDNINAQDEQGMTPLMHAIDQRKSEIALYLIHQPGIDLQIKDIKNRSARSYILLFNDCSYSMMQK